MGKRKSRKKPVVRKVVQKVATSFDCPFCNHEKAVEARLDRNRSEGTVLCTVCGASYQTTIHDLTEPIDVYSEWIDECEAANR